MEQEILDHFYKKLLQVPKRMMIENGSIIEVYDQPERSKREDLVFKQPDFEKMREENPCLYSKYESAKNSLECGALNIVVTQ